MAMDAPVRVPARVDPWVVGAVVVALVAVTAILVPLLLDPRVAALARIGIGVMWLGAVGLTLGMSLPVGYRLEGRGLAVRAGLLTLRFAYPDIVRADRVISPLAGPAWSLVRVRLGLDGGAGSTSPRATARASCASWRPGRRTCGPCPAAWRTPSGRARERCTGGGAVRTTGARTEAGMLAWPARWDPWAVAIVAGALLAMLGSAIAVWLDPGAGATRVPVLVMVVVVFAGIWALMLPLRIEFTMEALRVRAGLLRRSIAFADLVRVESTWSLVSTPTSGLSLQRVRLVDVRGKVLEVGPRDRVGFLAEVLARAPQLVEDPSAGPRRAWRDPARERPRHRRRLV